METALDDTYQGNLRQYRSAVDDFDRACKAWLDSRRDLSILETKRDSDLVAKKSQRLQVEKLRIKAQYLDTIRKEKNMCSAFALKAKLELEMAEEAAAWARGDDQDLYHEMEALYDDLSAESRSTAGSDSSLETVEDDFEQLSVVTEKVQIPAWANEYLLAPKHTAASSPPFVTIV
ncbi:hypothetical protein DXG01_003541 [Tephrocybe rancida]|nr:hypothetical protein DXG01_003541 [Tephrocybe rancida]